MAIPLVLLVEDNFEFIRAADSFLSSVNVAHPFARDYKTASALLAPNDFQEYDGVITDCFFPYETGSQDISLGKSLIEKMLSTDSTGQRIEEYEKFLAPYFNINDEEVRKIIRYIGSEEKEKPMKSSLAAIVKLIGGVDKEKLGETLKQSRWIFERSGAGINQFKDYYDALRRAIEKDPSNQPLGILIGEECQERKIPFVLATSTYHHDELTQPIGNYCSRNRWTLVDCAQNNPNEKSQESFWRRTYESLLKEMRK